MRHNAIFRTAGWFALLAMSAVPAPVPAATPPGSLIVNVASAEHTTGPVPPGSPIVTQSNTVATPVIALAGLELEKSAVPAGPIAPGGAIVFHLTLRNPSGVDFTNVVVTDPLDPLLGIPTSITDATVSNSGAGASTLPLTGAYDSMSRAVRWDIPVVPDGAALTLSFTCQIDPAAPDDSILRNTGSQTSDQDPNGASSNELIVPVVAPALVIDKQASRSRAEVGDVIGYTVLVTNISRSLDLHGAEIRDRLPVGFRFIEGSARLNGKKLPDPVALSKKGRDLVFDVGDLRVGESGRLSYATVPGPEADGRDGQNTAWVTALTPAGSALTAGPVQASVRVAGSLLSGEGLVIGRVFVDDNRDGVFQEGEVGVPQARVYLEDGTFTFTDVVGKYHIEGVRPGLHVVKVDATTMPDGLGTFASWSRSAGGGGTQFTDVGPDQMFKSNVASGGWGISVSRLTAHARIRRNGATGRSSEAPPETTEVVLPSVLAGALFEPGSAEIPRTARAVVEGYAALLRERGGAVQTVEVEPSYYPLADQLLMDQRAERLRAELSRLLLAAAPRPTGEALASASPASGGSGPASPHPPGEVVAASEDPRSQEIAQLETRVAQMTPDPAVLTPTEGAILSAERSNVEVKLPSGLTPSLKINGRTVALDQISVRMEAVRGGLIFYRYQGVAFEEGRNSVVLEGLDPWGNQRAWVERIILRVGAPRRLTIHPEPDSLKADGRTPVELRVEVRDGEGLPVKDGTLVTVDVDTGQLLGTDASPAQEGYQARTRGGVATVHLSPASVDAHPTVTASVGEATGQAVVSLAPDIREWIMAGVGEATVGNTGAAHQGVGGISSQGPTLSELLDEDTGAQGRVALFARGRLFGASLMTLSLDSGRQRDRDEVFRRLAPDRFFPIYGDSSAQGYEVEGQGKFSMRLDQPRSSFTVGDFTTGLAGSDLLRYDRALTGGSGRVELNGFSLQSFGATTPQSQVRDELDGGGISGPYRLSRRRLVVNSERIVLETRDRFHPERILDSKEMSRYGDYDIDYENGSLLFKQPVPFQDDDFNAVVIVAIYESLDGGGKQTVAGGRAGYKFGETAEIGTTYVNEGRDAGDFVLRGADFKLRHRFDTALVELAGEAATSEAGGTDPTGAVSFRSKASFGPSVSLTAHYRNVSSGFENPSRAGLPDAGTLRWGVDADATLKGDARLKGEYFTQRDELHGQDRTVGAIDWEKRIGRVTARTGVKALEAIEPTTGGSERSRLMSGGATMKLTEKLDGFLSRQQVVAGASLVEYPTRTALGLGYKFTEEIHGFARQELDHADAGDASRTVVGMESRIARNTVMESRYSLEDSLNGARGFAHLGLRSRLPLNQDWLGDFNLERVTTTQGLDTGDFSALGVGFEYLPARVKFTTRYELRLGDREDRHAITTAGATRLTDSVSVFTRERLFLVNPEDDRARLDGDGLVGLAYRPVSTDKLNFLVKLQGLKGDGASGAGSVQARSYLGIFETNYEPVARLHVLGRVAMKESRDSLEGDSFMSRTWLAEARGLVDIGQRFNAGLSARFMNQITGRSTVTGFGLESGFRAMKDMWVIGGYNLTGFKENGFGDTDRRSAGPFLSVRFKFDEETVLGLAKKMSASGPDPASAVP